MRNVLGRELSVGTQISMKVSICSGDFPLRIIKLSITHHKRKDWGLKVTIRRREQAMTQDFTWKPIAGKIMGRRGNPL